MTQRVLKFLALASMLYDHVYRLFGQKLVLDPLANWCEQLVADPALADFATNFYRLIQTLLPYPGRLAAPIFLFLVANGYRHTHSLYSYLFRLFGFALLAQIPYSLYFWAYAQIPLENCQLNFLFTLALGILAIWGWEHPFLPRGKSLADQTPLAQMGWRFFSAAVFLGAAGVFHCEGGFFFALLVPIFYWTHGWTRNLRGYFRQFALWLCLFCLTSLPLLTAFLQEPSTFALETLLLYTVGPCLGVFLTTFYNGRKGGGGRVEQYLFYVFYPVHLLILASIFIGLYL